MKTDEPEGYDQKGWNRVDRVRCILFPPMIALDCFSNNKYHVEYYQKYPGCNCKVHIPMTTIKPVKSRVRLRVYEVPSINTSDFIIMKINIKYFLTCKYYFSQLGKGHLEGPLHEGGSKWFCILTLHMLNMRQNKQNGWIEWEGNITILSQTIWYGSMSAKPGVEKHFLWFCSDLDRCDVLCPRPDWKK